MLIRPLAEMPKAEFSSWESAAGANMTPPASAADRTPAPSAVVFFLDKELPFLIFRSCFGSGTGGGPHRWGPAARRRRSDDLDHRSERQLDELVQRLLRDSEAAVAVGLADEAVVRPRVDADGSGSTAERLVRIRVRTQREHDGAVVVHLLLDGSDDVRAPLRRRVLVRPDADGPFADLLALLPDLEREVVTVHEHREVVGGRLDGVLAGVHPAARTVRTRRQQDVRPVPALLDHGNPGRGA